MARGVFSASLFIVCYASFTRFQTLTENNLNVESNFDAEGAELQQSNIDLAPDYESVLNRSLAEKSYLIRNGGATSETQKEYEIFNFYLRCGEGRSTTYISTIYNLTDNSVRKLAKRNYWEQRAADYDIDALAEKLKLEQDSRAIEHKRRLESYRQQQEFLGRSLTANAAKLAALSQRTLDAYIDDPSRQVDMRDIPGLLNSAAKLAEVGKSLQSGALGVEQLLVALEEADIDE